MNCRIEKKSSFEVFGIERIFESHDLDEIPKLGGESVRWQSISSSRTSWPCRLL